MDTASLGPQYSVFSENTIHMEKYYINFMNDNTSGAGLRLMENAARLPFCVVPVHDRR